MYRGQIGYLSSKAIKSGVSVCVHPTIYSAIKVQLNEREQDIRRIMLRGRSVFRPQNCVCLLMREYIVNIVFVGTFGTLRGLCEFMFLGHKKHTHKKTIIAELIVNPSGGDKASVDSTHSSIGCHKMITQLQSIQWHAHMIQLP